MRSEIGTEDARDAVNEMRMEYDTGQHTAIEEAVNDYLVMQSVDGPFLWSKDSDTSLELAAAACNANNIKVRHLL